jgi:hypothetical protein
MKMATGWKRSADRGEGNAGVAASLDDEAAGWSAPL